MWLISKGLLFFINTLYILSQTWKVVVYKLASFAAINLVYLCTYSIRSHAVGAGNNFSLVARQDILPLSEATYVTTDQPITFGFYPIAI
jgi:hypothetical protein